MDSALVYRGMDIGTAKPTPEERHAVAHHLIDMVDPLQATALRSSHRTALPSMQDIRARGRVPLLVGGTLLYLGPCCRAWTTCRRPMPACASGWNTRPRARLAGAAPASGRGGPGHGSPPAARRQPAHPARAGGVRDQRSSAVVVSWCQAGRPRPAVRWRPGEPGTDAPRLAARAHRAALRRHAGTGLSGRGAHAAGPRRPARRAAIDALRRLPPGLGNPGRAWRTPGRPGLASLRERGIFATRQLAKRQLTWLRGMPERRWWPATGRMPWHRSSTSVPPSWSD
jgi:tRNA dimethylallyltransferase